MALVSMGFAIWATAAIYFLLLIPGHSMFQVGHRDALSGLFSDVGESGLNVWWS